MLYGVIVSTAVFRFFCSQEPRALGIVRSIPEQRSDPSGKEGSWWSNVVRDLRFRACVWLLLGSWWLGEQ
jgi:hypothetical protein